MDLSKLDFSNPLVITGFAILLFFVLGLLLLVYAMGRTWKVIQARGWHSTQGRVIGTEVGKEWTSESASVYAYFPKVTYEYIVGATRYVGDKMALASPDGHTDERVIQQQLLQYPVGRILPVYYNPRNPAEAVLERKSPQTKVLWGVSVLILGIDLVVAMLWLFLGTVMRW